MEKTSIVTSFYNKKPNTTKAICKLCDTEIERTERLTTSGLINHLTGFHKIKRPILDKLHILIGDEEENSDHPGIFFCFFKSYSLIME